MSDPTKEAIQEIVQQASVAAGGGQRFLSSGVTAEVAANLTTIWTDCRRKREADRMIQRARDKPHSIAAEVVRSKIYSALPPAYKSADFVDRIVAEAASKLSSGHIPLD